MNAGRLAEKVVLVTGGASGIGAACAERLAQEGAHIVVGDLKPDPSDKGSLLLDVGDAKSVAHTLGAIIGRYGAA